MASIPEELCVCISSVDAWAFVHITLNEQLKDKKWKWNGQGHDMALPSFITSQREPYPPPVSACNHPLHWGIWKHLERYAQNQNGEEGFRDKI